MPFDEYYSLLKILLPVAAEWSLPALRALLTCEQTVASSPLAPLTHKLESDTYSIKGNSSRVSSKQQL